MFLRVEEPKYGPKQKIGNTKQKTPNAKFKIGNTKKKHGGKHRRFAE